ncbi:MAG: xanthine dehydrogenase [Proteobacteria bacterium]|nr:xanthine dehydrogenase [Pseudomonadota bacterium]
MTVSPPRLVPHHPALQVVGQPVPRPDAPDKVKGTARYVDDLAFNGQLHARVLRSPHARARIARIETAEAEKMAGVHAVLTAKDIPGQNLIPMIKSDWLLLADGEVCHAGEPLALVAAETRAQADAALAALRVVYEPLEPVLTIEDAFDRGDVHTHWKVLRGDVDAAFADPSLVVFEATYRTPYQEHAYLETNGVIATPDGCGGIVVYGSLQCPFYVQKAVGAVLGLPLNLVRIVQLATGGGFGGKEDAPSSPGALCALLAWKTGRPVKYIMSREEDMVAMSKRHPGKIRYKTAATRDGIIKAVEVDYFLNGGAYTTLSPVVLWRGLIHACGPYRVENARVNAWAVRTNTVPCGAFRGFGEPQVVFASEAHVDHMAEKLGLDPLAMRRANMLDYGDVTVTGHPLESSVGFREVVDRVTEAAEFERKRREYDAQDPTSPVRRGIGLAVTYYGVGLGALGKHLNPAGANVVVAADGTVTLAVGTTEIGQGMLTVLSQIAAEELGCAVTAVRVVEPDTSRVPDSGPTVASRTTLMSGNAVRDGCRQIKARMHEALAQAGHDVSLLSFTDAVREATGLCVQLSAQGWSVPPKTTFDTDTGEGHPYVTYTWSANTVEVEVDTRTGEVRPIKVVSGHDVGKMINPQTGEGQIEGGVVQGLGYGLVEEHLLREGRILNHQFSTYIIPTPMDAPEIVPIIVEHAYPWGPYGAKGLGETPLIGVAPAVVNAIAHALRGAVKSRDALYAGLREIPATPERVWEAWRTANAE